MLLIISLHTGTFEQFLHEEKTFCGIIIDQQENTVKIKSLTMCGALCTSLTRSVKMITWRFLGQIKANECYEVSSCVEPCVYETIYIITNKNLMFVFLFFENKIFFKIWM